jgi:outer membrane protein assembly factor BamB
VTGSERSGGRVTGSERSAEAGHRWLSSGSERSGEAGEVIDLGVVERSRPQWEPPVAWSRRFGREARWLALALVAAVVAGLLAAGGARPPQRPVFRLDYQVLEVAAAAGRVFAIRYGNAGGGRRIEAFDARAGRPLWSLPVGLEHHLAFARGGTLLTVSGNNGRDAQDSVVTAFDPATGAELWHRDAVGIVGWAGDVILGRDLTDLPEPRQPDADPTAEPEPLQHEQRFFAFDRRTGQVAWTLVVPAGSAVSFGRDRAQPYRLTSLFELDPDGRLRVRDLRTAAVTGERRLDWSGPFDMFDVSDDGLLGARQIVVSRPGTGGVDVLDGGTGARLWHRADEPYSGLFACAAERYCTTRDGGLDAIDAATGLAAWHVEGYPNVLWSDGRYLVVGGFQEAPAQTVVVVDGRTGAVLHRLDGWAGAWSTRAQVVVSRAAGERTSVVATLDPASGRMSVLGRGDRWFGQPQCDVDGRTLACLASGDLSVWRLPPDPRG